MSSMSLAKQAAGALFGLLACATVMAAEPPQGGSGGTRPGPGAAPDDEVRQAMEQMVIARMTVALRLSEDQKEKVIPRVQALMRARRDHAEKRRASLARLRGLLQDETAGDQEIGRALRDVRLLEDQFRDREAGLRDAIDQDLKPRQQARMVFFEARLRRVMQHRIQEALREERGTGPGRGPGPPPGRRSARPAPTDTPDEWDAPEDEP